jgi:ADA HAT complex component 1
VELSHEILLKHNELRLINQEMAKCQVALEQLRRCHLIPFPATAPTPAQMLNISAGTGPPLQTPGQPVPQWAPPFGVVDGPYSRHYAKWLIPDPRFDGAAPVQREAATAATALGGRSMRTNSIEAAHPMGTKRGPRGSISGASIGAAASAALFCPPPPPRGRAGPCVLKRSDGKVVKLVCKGCARDNFSNTQGFLNHCRIAHQAEYKSHDEAAMACGVEVSADTPVTAAPPRAQGRGRADSAVSAAGAAGASAVVAAPAVAGAPPPPPIPSVKLVHPLNRVDMTERQAYLSLLARIKAGRLMAQPRGGAAGGTADGVPATASGRPAPVTATPVCAEAPHLGRLLHSRNFIGDLDAIIRDAKTVDPMVKDDDDEVDMIEPEVQAQARGHGAMRMPARSQAPAEQPQQQQQPRRPRPHAASFVGESDDVRMLDIDHATPQNLHAPSLVSDDGEPDDSCESSSESDTGDVVMAPEPAVADDDGHSLAGATAAAEKLKPGEAAPAFSPPVAAPTPKRKPGRPRTRNLPPQN